MGDTHNDPTDHFRTTHAHAGISVKDNFFWPGFVLLAVGLCGMAGTATVAAYQRYEWLEATIAISVLGTIAGALWLLIEVRFITGIDEQTRADS
jgi:hypothetical protein